MSLRLITLALLFSGLVASLIACDEHATNPSGHTPDIPWQTIARFDEPVGVARNYVWAINADDVYLAYSLEKGNSIADVRVAHFDGIAWTESSIPWTGPATSIWGSSKNDIYVAAGALVHFDGVQWSTLPLGAYHITGSGPNNVFIANKTSVLHYNGADWDTLRTTFDDFRELLAAAPDGSLFFNAGQGTSIWNGASWTDSSFPTDMASLFPLSASDAFSVVPYGDGAIYHWDGQDWKWQAAASNIVTMGGTSGSDVYALGVFGVMFHYDGAQWTPLSHVTAHSLYDASSTSSGVAVACGNNKVLWLDRHGSRVLREAVIEFTRFPVAGASSQHFMLSDFNSIYRYDAGIWSEAPLPFSAGTPRALGGRTIDDMYLSTDDGLIAHYNGTSWDHVDSLLQPNAFWVTPSGSAYAVDGGSVLRRSRNWEAIKSGSQYMYLITGDGGDGIVTGARLETDPDHIVISHFDGINWSALPTSPDYVYDLWAGPNTDLYLAAQRGVYHLRGNRYDRISEPNQEYDFIFGRPDGRVVAMSRGNKMGVFDGAAFEPLTGRSPWQAVRLADGSIVAEVDWELLTWVP